MDIKPIVIKEKHKGGIENRSSLMQNGVKRIGVIGGSGSGKTTWLTHWFIAMMHEPIGGVTVVAKNTEQDQYTAIEAYCKKSKIPYQMLEEYTMEDMKELRKDDTPKLVIYDDLAGTDDFDALLATSKYGRVKHIYLAVLGQDYTSIPKEVRQNLNMYAIFPLGAPHAARAMISGLSAFVNEDNLKKAYKWIQKPVNKYSCIIIQLDGRSVIMDKEGALWDLKNFQSIVLEGRKGVNKGSKKNDKETKEEGDDDASEDEKKDAKS